MPAVPSSQVGPGGMPYAPWRAAMVPASFRGATFRVVADQQGGGRRAVVHEFPERDTPFSEDMGRRARRWQLTGYVLYSPSLVPDVLAARDKLIAQLEASGPGTLQHPTLGQVQAICDTYSVTEEKDRGGLYTFQMTFVEAGSLDGAAVTANTQQRAATAAQTLMQVAAAGLDRATQASLTATGGVVAA